MQIELKEITVRELTNGYADNGDAGVTGYSGKLDIRPPYQREFIYKPEQEAAVIDTVMKGYPLNVMFWATHNDGTYEVMDGQQRTLSLCQYVAGDFSVSLNGNALGFVNLRDDQRNVILDYKLMVYVCTGTDSEKLEWFKTINIAGEKLTDQELRNAVYHGTWVTDAKRYFSKPGCAAYKLGSDYINGSPIRQDYLETAIGWLASEETDGEIDAYMAAHQNDATAIQLWNYYQSVMSWVAATFTKKRRIMKGVAWGLLYNRHHTEVLDPKVLEAETARLLMDDDVTHQSGIYPYLLTHEERYLSIRAFTNAQKQDAYERQHGICPFCHQSFSIEEMEGDHITPWCEGGKTITDNLQMLCKDCNRRKGGK
jgi:hypothetical protein